ncbi:RHOMBOID-like protein 8 [Impatiens glandulifera]|uniref:RHOMBOID-like protein 8 n=1 Tax=Impatiens glandulifera TaxID=253017 RepID=UPI001FB0D0D4|nr:RHOMBOID-like protein 8 [Impatiens glandulifera]
MAEPIKIQTNIDVQPSHSILSLDVVSKDLHKEQKVPFFRSISQRGDNTWLISLFVIIHLVAFTSTMIVNDCWHNSHGYCTLKSLGRFSFQPLSENPLLGPSASAMDAMGAVRQSLLVQEHQMWRLFSSPWLHAGFIHLIVNLSCIIFIGIQLEQEFGACKYLLFSCKNMLISL